MCALTKTFINFVIYNIYKIGGIVMAKTREIACIHYKAEGVCDLGKEGTFRRQCQKCKTYKAIPGGKPARTDTRKKRLERIQRKDKYF